MFSRACLSLPARRFPTASRRVIARACGEGLINKRRRISTTSTCSTCSSIGRRKEVRLYQTLTEQDVSAFRQLLLDDDDDDDSDGNGKDGVLLYDDNNNGCGVLLEPFNQDWTRHYKGKSQLVLQPASTAQVSRLLKYCCERELAVVPQGGNTGLVGGSVSRNENEIVLSTSRMNHVHDFDAHEGVLHCQTGCILQDLQEHASNEDFLVPIDLGSKGTCQIGGNLSSNAGGIYYYRYGSLAANLLGVTVVLADGRILKLGSRNRKDNTGYKLQNLFLGAEGTLGIITNVMLQCHPYPKSKQAAFLACPDYTSVLLVRQAAKSILGEILSALEWMDRNIYDIVMKKQQSSSPLFGDNNCPHYLLVETHGSNEEHDAQKMQAFLDHVLSTELVADGVVAHNTKQMDLFWKIRDACNPCISSLGYTYKYDVSLPVASFEEFGERVSANLTHFCGGGDNTIICAKWGHILDGNLHLNATRIGQSTVDPLIQKRLDEVVYDGVINRGGSISAEHGIGQAKRQYLHRVHDQDTLNAMKDLKKLLDPKGILNPGKLL